MWKKYFLLCLIILGLFNLPLYAGKRGSSAMGLKLSSPQLLSFSYTTYPYHFWLVQLEPGIGGGKVNVGIGGNWRYTIGLAYKASMIHTWIKPIGGIKSNQTYLGSEFEIMWRGVNLTFGEYSHFAGNAPERDVIVTVGLGIGF